MKKTRTRIMALLGALALTVWGIGMTGCSHDEGFKIHSPTDTDKDEEDTGSGGSGGSAGGTLYTERRAIKAPAAPGTVTLNGTIKASLKDAWDSIGSSGNYTITLTAGTYDIPVLSYTGDANITISGKGTEEFGLDVLITGNPNTASQKSRELVYIAGGAANLVLENLTIQNKYTIGQAEALSTDGTGNLAAYNCSFLSHQDTIRTVGKAWFYKCYIEGDVDFLWMESSGKVALYEECVLRAVNDRTNKAYFTAPRANDARYINKGLVIYNSTLEAEDMEVYLGRNVWPNGGYYINVAIVGSTFYGTLHNNVWQNAADGTSDQQYIGFKTDSYFAKSAAGYGTILSPQMVSTEYAGRTNIMNRVYDTTAKKFKPEAESTRWDISTIITNNNWTVVPDNSSHILVGETELKTKEYDFSAADANGYKEATVSGFAHETGKTHAQGATNSTITIPVEGKAVVTVSGYYSGNGTIQANSQGAALYDFNNKSTNKIIEKTYVVYNPNATSVTITANSSTYITKIVVEYDDNLTFVPVTAIALSSADNETTVKAKKTLQFTAALTPIDPTNSDVKWEITEGGTAASIDQNGLLTAGTPTSDTPVTVKVTSLDADGVSATKRVTVLKIDDNAGSITWAPNGATTVSLAANNSEANGAATGSVFSIYWADETSPIDASNLTIGSGRNHTSVSYSKEGVFIAKDATILTYQFPVTAGSSAITLTNFAYKFGYNTTNNLNGTVSVISGNETVYEGTALKSGSTEGHSTDGIVASEELDVPVAAGQTVTVVVKITPTGDLTTNTNPFIIADVVLDFEKQ